MADSKQNEGEVGRNDPCPCGSGKKYKRCCEAKGFSEPGERRRRWLNPVTSGVALVLVGALLLWGVTTLTSGFTPEPWEYDAANDRYWHPGHAGEERGHWHQGRPPGSETAEPGPTPQGPPPLQGPSPEGAAQPQAPGSPEGADASAPEPWEYDQENNRHFDPNHGHWHAGPPPPEALR